MTFQTFIGDLSKTISNNSPAILTSIGITGVVTTAVLAAHASFKASEKLHYTPPHLTKTEKAKLVWPHYIVPVGSGVLTITCIIAASKISSKRFAAMAAFASLSEKALIEYKDEVLQTIGVYKEEKVRANVAQKHMDTNPLSKTDVFITGQGDTLCYDSISGRYFQSSVDKLKKAANELNYELVHNMYASLNEFFNLIGLPTTPFGDIVGWTANELLDLKFSAVLAENDQPCICLDYSAYPVKPYANGWQ